MAAAMNGVVNGVLQSTATDLPYTFGAPGNYTITLIARSSDPLCDSAMKTITIRAVCPVAASFTKSATTAGAGTSITFTNTSTGVDGYEWSVNGAYRRPRLISLILHQRRGIYHPSPCNQFGGVLQPGFFGYGLFHLSGAGRFHAFVGHHPAEYAP